MQEMKTEMVKTEGITTTKNPKKANLMDPNAIKNLLDESVTEIVTSRGYKEDVRMSNFRLFMGTIIIIIALVAQFYPKKFPENRDFLIGCIVLYVFFNGLLQLVIHTKEKNAFLFTYPPTGCFKSSGLMVTSKLPRFTDTYTLTIASAVSGKDPVELSKKVTEWFTKDGVLVEGLLSKDVEALINKYSGESRKSR